MIFVLLEHNTRLRQKFCDKFFVFTAISGYPASTISRISGIRYPAKKVSGPTLNLALKKVELEVGGTKGYPVSLGLQS